MSLWRCPHCATPQPEAARCWVCLRSTTSCATCAHFRRGVAAGLGYCGLDRQRLPLRGDEIRGCWTGRPDAATAQSPAGSSGARSTAHARGADGSAADRQPRTFVPVDELAGHHERGGTDTRVAAAGPHRTVPVERGPLPAPAPPARWSLWGDAEA